MNPVSYRQQNKDVKKGSIHIRIRVLFILIILVSVAICSNLFLIMIMQHDFYTAMAAGSHEMYEQLFPKRGEVFIQDSRSGEEYPLAINRDYFTVYINTKKLVDEEEAEDVTKKISEFFGYDDEEKLSLFLKINERDDPYEPIEKKVEESKVEKLRELNLTGLGFVRRPYRYYPEGELAAHVVGFVGKNEDGMDIGRYGVEGYWQNQLAGSGGFFEGFRTAVGEWIPLGGRSFQPAEDGTDLLLSVDRTVQYMACKRMQEAIDEYEASGGALVVIEPETGAIRAMCSFPDFDPNKYNEVESIEIFNNTAIFTPYEPGSIFKPVTMAAAINEGVVEPDSVFEDTGPIEDLCMKPINNAEGTVYGKQTMTQVLENSVNTGMVHVVEKLGKYNFIDYLENFGFGMKEGIELDSEVSGTIETLREIKKDKLDCYTATASFGQGITATPLQMASAFATIANGGILMRPFIVEEIRYANGKVEKTKPKEIKRVLDKRTASLLSGMLVSVIDNGQSQNAQVDGYYVAGKTGTAQIAGKGGYTDETNHSFVGFAPVDDPAFVIVIKIEKPKRKYASYTTTPVFRDIAEFLLKYYQVSPVR
ncbi:MAG: hypothetical protein GF349_02120 [Candidatus Magasanikbacteria bacterium]|nr:hypothetical protein [Candidatus Magasanikbacteria bacterium]